MTPKSVAHVLRIVAFLNILFFLFLFSFLFFQPFSGFVPHSPRFDMLPAEEGLDGFRAPSHRQTAYGPAKELSESIHNGHASRALDHITAKSAGADAHRFVSHRLPLLGEALERESDAHQPDCALHRAVFVLFTGGEPDLGAGLSCAAY
jgi:hypothetical protein